MKPTELQLVNALRRLVRASRAVIADPGDFGLHTEGCKRDYKEATNEANRLLRSYRKESNGKPPK